MEKMEKNKEAVAIRQFDLSKFFDKESLLDCLNELYKSNVKGKTYKLIYEMNKDTRVKVRTAVGDGKFEETDEGLAQGSMEAAIASTNSISNGVTDFFSESEYEVSYGPVKMDPAQFLDDISRLALDPVSAQMGNDRLENIAETKLLNYNLLKTCIIILGNKKAREKLRNEFEEKNPTLYGENVNIVTQATYLGDKLGLSVSESISLTLKKRIGLVKRSIFEIKAVVEDCRSKIIGGIKTGILLWEACVIPFLLYNSSTWLQMKKSDIEILCKLQRLFLSSLLGIKNCPAVAMLWDLGILDMPMRILKEKLLLYHHISCLPENALSFRILQTQEQLHLPSLREEVAHFLAKHEIHDVRQFSKEKWKIYVRKAILEMNRSQMLEQMKSSKKLDELSLSLEEFKLKDYFTELSFENIRIKFRERSKTMTTCRTHYPSDQENIKLMFECPNRCGNIDSLLHWRSCTFYRQFRESKNMENDKQLGEFYKSVINLRMKTAFQNVQ